MAPWSRSRWRSLRPEVCRGPGQSFKKLGYRSGPEHGAAAGVTRVTRLWNDVT